MSASEDGERPAQDEPAPLLHSLHEFAALITACLDVVAPQTVLEVGSETGALARDLCDWAARNDARVTIIEPAPSQLDRELATRPQLRLIERKSPQALADVGPVDVAILDGDHNYWVVSHELRELYGSGRGPLVFVHDIGWPCARRDQYYDPQDIPAEHRHEYSYDGGVVPGEEGMTEDGFRGEGAFAYAVREGGPGNGVLTAVEDVLAEREDLELLRIPCIFGLGVVLPRDAPWAAAVREVVGPLRDSDLLRRMEANRLALYLQIIGGLTPARRHARGVRDLIAAQNREIEELQVELTNLRGELASAAARDAPPR